MIVFFQSLGFAAPLALLALVSLPLIWWLLRFTPPQPRQQMFPPIRILLGLKPTEETPDKTPWWLLLLRLALAALVIFAVAQPFLQTPGTGQLPSGLRLVVLDDGFASAQHWPARRQALFDVLDDAQAQGDPVVLVRTAPSRIAVDHQPVAARAALDLARALKPSPLATDRLAALKKLPPEVVKDVASIIWLSDGLEAASATDFVQALQATAPSAPLRILAPTGVELPIALGSAKVEKADIVVPIVAPRGQVPAGSHVEVKATNGRVLLDVPVTGAEARFTLPTALRNDMQSITLAGQGHAAARQLFDDRWRRRTVALQSGDSVEQVQPLLSPLHYVSRGLEPFAELFEPQTPADVASLIDAGLSMLVMADMSSVAPEISGKVEDWIAKGGILLRFAGPRLAAGHDGFIPVQLREGDRTLGSALSWETPQTIQPFPTTSPFVGLTIDPAITISRQVLAEPDATLAERTWASLADGTPLVTAERRGKGLIVLFHVTANANWSNLPLSGLFVEMMQRVAGLDTSQPAASTVEQGSAYAPRLVMTGEGDLVAPDGDVQSIPLAAAATAKVNVSHPPGLYAMGGKELALNHVLTEADLAPHAETLGGIAVSAYTPPEKTSFVPSLVIAAMVAFLLDCIATLFLGGGLSRFKSASVAVLAILLLLPDPAPSLAQDAEQTNMEAALAARLAYVKTGNAEIDGVSAEGLRGLTAVLSARTSAGLAEPRGVDVATDELVFYPVLYWPVDEAAQALPDATRNKVAAYMKNGGTIFFDLRNGGLDVGSTAGDALRRMLANLDVPPLEPVPEKHVLTRSFYLLQSFPGRYDGGPLWVESALGEASSDPGTADGVSSIIIGSNDYAAAWALDDAGQPLYAVVPGAERQREFAFRTGVNVVMYALTGNYKADQVHVPALLERLGQ